MSMRCVAVTARRKTTVVALFVAGLFALVLVASLHQDTYTRILNFSNPSRSAEGASATESQGSTEGKLKGTPASYPKVIKAEKALPQHNLDLPYPEGRHGRYVKFSNQIKALGWNNVLGEILLDAHLAWRSKRAYVFQDYVWKVEYYPWEVPDYPWPHTPLSALISGPVAGGSWAPGDNTPRSVREDHWEKVCPPEDTEIIDTDIGKEPVFWSNGVEVMEHWVKLLTDSPKRCVDIQPSLSGKDGYPQTFDLWLVSQKRILDLWPEFREGPISQLLKTSPLVESAIMRNEHLFHSEIDHPANIYDRMMTVHIRRGDYAGACKGLADWNSTFYGWNLLPIHPDPFTAGPGGGWGWNTPENEALYKERCYPTDEQLLEKMKNSRDEWEAESALQGEHRKLDVIYVMTNANKAWVESFKPALRHEGWTTIVSSHDLVLDDEQIGVNNAVDMDLARRSALFIGNGWSSMTSNINHRRLVDGKQRLDNRFW